MRRKDEVEIYWKRILEASEYWKRAVDAMMEDSVPELMLRRAGFGTGGGTEAGVIRCRT